MSAPQITPAQVEALIAFECYHNAQSICEQGYFVEFAGDYSDKVQQSLGLLTLCVLVLQNGHTVTGDSYCADPAKFDAQRGRDEARKVAIAKLWPMVIYAERERLRVKGLIESCQGGAQ